MKRKALIGFSSPTAYFYDHDQKYFREPWRWNPILESPQGLITLFDELWFVNRSLCPVNLRNEDYVYFLDEESEYKSTLKFVLETYLNNDYSVFIQKFPLTDYLIDTHSEYSQEQFKRYNKVVSSIYGKSDNLPIDNHSHEINLLGYSFNGNSMRTDLITLDIAIMQSISSFSKFELVSNSFNVNAFKNFSKNFNKIKISDAVTISRIPILQTPIGPVIKDIEKLRENNYLLDFRNKIMKQNTSENFEEDIVLIESEFKKYRNDVLLTHQNKAGLLESISTTLFEKFTDLVLPFFNDGKKQYENYEVRKKNWTGFIASLE